MIMWQVTMRLRAFFDDACFTVAAQDAFLSGFAAEVAHALNIDVGLVLDLNAFRAEKHNEMKVGMCLCTLCTYVRACVRACAVPARSKATDPIEKR